MPSHRRSRRHRVVLVVGAVVALVAAGAAGRWTAPRSPLPAAGAAAVPAGGPGFARSPAGAQAAAAWFITGIYGGRGEPAGRLAGRFGGLVSRPEALERVLALARTDLDGRAVPAGSLTRVACVGVRLDAYTADAARIAVWSVLVQADPAVPSGVPVQRWLVDEVSLEWRGGRWVFAATATVHAPVPPHPGQDVNAVGAAAELLGGPAQVFQAVPDGR
jgi:hypothetical protein